MVQSSSWFFEGDFDVSTALSVPLCGEDRKRCRFFLRESCDGEEAAEEPGPDQSR